MDVLFGSSSRRFDPGPTPVEHVMPTTLLRRVLASIGRDIDAVVNDRFVKNEVLGYYKVHQQVERRSEALDLEHQWNPLGRVR